MSQTLICCFPTVLKENCTSIVRLWQHHHHLAMQKFDPKKNPQRLFGFTIWMNNSKVIKWLWHYQLSVTTCAKFELSTSTNLREQYH